MLQVEDKALIEVIEANLQTYHGGLVENRTDEDNARAQHVSVHVLVNAKVADDGEAEGQSVAKQRGKGVPSQHSFLLRLIQQLSCLPKIKLNVSVTGVGGNDHFEGKTLILVPRQ